MGAVFAGLCTVPAIIAGVGVGASLAGGTMFGSSGVLFRLSLFGLAVGLGAALRWQWEHEPAFRLGPPEPAPPRCEWCKTPVSRHVLTIHDGLCVACYAEHVAYLAAREVGR